MRCYLVAEHYLDGWAVQQALERLGVEIVTPDRASAVPGGTIGWLPDVDFVLAVFPASGGWLTPPAMYLDIGVAIGMQTPVLIMAEPPRRVDAALSPLAYVRVDLRNVSAIHARLSQFINLVEAGLTPAEPAPYGQLLASEQLESFRREFDELATSYRKVPENAARIGGRRRDVAQRFERVALELLRAAGAEVDESRESRLDRTGATQVDAAMYVPGTEDIFREPLFLETKLLDRSVLEQQMLAQLAAYSTMRDAAYGVLLWWNPLQRHSRVRQRGGRYPIIALNADELLDRLSGETLAQVLRHERNVLVHGGVSA